MSILFVVLQNFANMVFDLRELKKMMMNKTPYHSLIHLWYILPYLVMKRTKVQTLGDACTCIVVYT